MNQYTKHLNRIEFVITMACTGRCKHCSEGEHVSNGEHMNGDIGAKAILDICNFYDIKSVMTFGGEPLLFPEDVCKIHAAAKTAGIQKRDLITNGFFSKEKGRIKEVAYMLAENGLGTVTLSVDAFHQETIPMEPVVFFADCIKKERIGICVHPAWLVSEADENPYNVRTREILRVFERMDIKVSGGNVIFPCGNAKKYLGEYFDDTVEYTNPYEENPRDIRAISFNPNGDVLNGNINRDTIMDIIESYRVGADK